eukprot:scaffold510513_cov17-Prasinocladus_malaysianus.AAC.1
MEAYDRVAKARKNPPSAKSICLTLMLTTCRLHSSCHFAEFGSSQSAITITSQLVTRSIPRPV